MRRRREQSFLRSPVLIGALTTLVVMSTVSVVSFALAQLSSWFHTAATVCSVIAGAP